jgi:hypothetical protein
MGINLRGHMKTGFKDKVDSQSPKKFKNPWDFTAPAYDERTSCFINAGTHHGVGKNQPVGTEGNPKGADAVPKGRIETLKVANVSYETLEAQ